MTTNDRNSGFTDDHGSVTTPRLAGSFEAKARPVVTVDIKKYEALLDDPSLSEVQREEFLRALWSIVVSFVELGFGVHPLQEVCGQDSGNCCERPKEVFDEVRLNTLDETQEDTESGPIAGLEENEYA